MEEIEIKVLNEQEDDVEIKPKTGWYLMLVNLSQDY